MIQVNPANGKQATKAASTACDPAPPVLWWTREFPGTEEQVRHARGWLAELLPDCGQLDVLTLLASEAVTNAILHTASGKPGGTFSVTVEWSPEAARALIADQGAPTAPAVTAQAGTAAWDREYGRGLFLVDQLAGDWGTAALPDGRLVWLDVAWAAKDGPPLEAPGGCQAAIKGVRALRRLYPGTTAWWGHRSQCWWAALPGALDEADLARAPTLHALSTVLAEAYPAFLHATGTAAPASRRGSRARDAGPVGVEALGAQ